MCMCMDKVHPVAAGRLLARLACNTEVTDTAHRTRTRLESVGLAPNNLSRPLYKVPFAECSSSNHQCACGTPEGSAERRVR